jgi:hypothetical protein
MVAVDADRFEVWYQKSAARIDELPPVGEVR